ncbi:hypothetical protein Pfo_026850 [Paulownia fortunei]|nr:hypothetical protein Pfo_026850 [Paulownia fortunei]
MGLEDVRFEFGISIDYLLAAHTNQRVHTPPLRLLTHLNETEYNVTKIASDPSLLFHFALSHITVALPLSLDDIFAEMLYSLDDERERDDVATYSAQQMSSAQRPTHVLNQLANPRPNRKAMESKQSLPSNSRLAGSSPLSTPCPLSRVDLVVLSQSNNLISRRAALIKKSNQL